MKTDSNTYYAIVLETIDSPEFTYKDANENPCLFKTELDAWKEIADGMICKLSAFIKGDYPLREEIFERDEFVIPVQIQDGNIIGEAHGDILVHKIFDNTEISFEP